MASKSNHRRVRYDRILAVLLVLILLIVLLVKCCSSSVSYTHLTLPTIA